MKKKIKLFSAPPRRNVGGEAGLECSVALGPGEHTNRVDADKRTRPVASGFSYKAGPPRRFIRTGVFFVYILECTDGTLYTGYTKDLAARLRLHNSGRGSKYVRARRPVKLVYFKKYRYYKIAVTEERRIKGLSRQAKVKLIRTYKTHKRRCHD